MKTRPWQDFGKISLALISLLLLQVSPAAAREILLLGGAEGGGGAGTSNYYTFVGAVAPVLDARLGQGVVQKYWIDVLGYDYPAGNRMITATGVGAEGALGYQKSGATWWGGGYAGVRYSDTWLTPDHPQSRVRGSQFRPSLQVEGEKSLTGDWKINGIARYLFVSDSYWTRGRIMYRSYGKVYTGPELIVHGDPDYRAWQGGWFVTGFAPLPGSSIGVKAGFRRVEGADTGVYAGLEFSRAF